MNSLLILTTTTTFTSIFTNAAGIFEKSCGSKFCQLGEFCSKFNNQCEGCRSVCEESSHNFERDLCIKECQDYLHDIRYIKSSNYTADTKLLQNQQKIMLIIIIILLILFVLVHGTHFIRWIRRRDCFFSLRCLKKLQKKQPTKQTQNDMIHQNPHTESPKVRPKLHLSERAPSTIYSVSALGNESTVHTVSTPISGRHPAEDSTLDYTYDNGGLVLTPVNEKQRP